MKKLISIILILSFTYAQSVGNVFSNNTKESDISSIQLTQDLDLTNLENLTYTPIEKSINPDTYMLGPGDLLGISIISTKNISWFYLDEDNLLFLEIVSIIKLSHNKPILLSVFHSFRKECMIDSYTSRVAAGEQIVGKS